jgi:WD40 repeat protein
MPRAGEIGGQNVSDRYCENHGRIKQSFGLGHEFILVDLADLRRIALWPFTPADFPAGLQWTISDLCWSSDGQWVAAVFGDNTVGIWRADNGKYWTTLMGHKKEIHGACFSSDNRMFATTSADGTARLWEVATGKLRHVLTADNPSFSVAAFGDKVGLLVTAGSENARIWDARSGKLVRTFPQEGRGVWSISFGKDGRTLATRTDDGDFSWSVDDGTCLFKRGRVDFVPDKWFGDMALTYRGNIGLMWFRPSRAALKE